ncbi:hypothetical protein ACFVSN_05210 [Kitasatospora sp. NPDC057904]|uniref:hypothetical protein n=1 Tax=unclassified Kitasatospora TaxID=2633591 RepID=UPI0036BEBFDA
MVSALLTTPALPTAPATRMPQRTMWSKGYDPFKSDLARAGSLKLIRLVRRSFESHAAH